jgi:hypothetical protein
MAALALSANTKLARIKKALPTKFNLPAKFNISYLN